MSPSPTLKRTLSFFLLVLVFSLPFWILGDIASRSPNSLPIDLPASALMALCPVLAAVIFAGREGGRGGVKRLFKRAFDYRRIARPAWLAPALLLMPAIMAASHFAMRLLGQPLPPPAIAPALFHAMFNVSEFLFPNYGSHYNPTVTAVVAWAAVIAVVALWGPRTLKRAPKEEAMKPRGQLMIEHRLIEKILAAAEALAARIGEESFDPLLMDSIVDFIKTYADRTHHGKEEDILFRELAKKGLEGERLAMMKALIDEHAQARAKVRRLAELNDLYKCGYKEVVSEIKEILLWLAGFYPAHIAREDKEFFPDTEKLFNGRELEAMLQEFRDFDREMIHEKYRSVAEAVGRRAKEQPWKP